MVDEIKTKNVFISGLPCVGKTTLIKETCLPYLDKVGGFYTEQIIENGKREGFVIKTFSNEQRLFAKKGLKSPYKVNKYGVDIEALEEIGIKAIQEAIDNNKIIIIDEIGTMELFSEKFRQILFVALNSKNKVLATIRHKSQPFTDEIKKYQDTTVIILTRDNFLQVKGIIRRWIEKEI
jgi:nucleoside-triphosphatase